MPRGQVSLPSGPNERVPIGCVSINDDEQPHLVLFGDGAFGINTNEEQFDGSYYSMLNHTSEQFLGIESNKNRQTHYSLFSFIFSSILFVFYLVIYVLFRINQSDFFIENVERDMLVLVGFILVMASYRLHSYQRGSDTIRLFISNSDTFSFDISKDSGLFGIIPTLSFVLWLAILVQPFDPVYGCDLILGIVLILLLKEHFIPGPLIILDSHKENTMVFDSDDFCKLSIDTIREINQKERIENPELTELLLSNESQHLEFKASLWTTYIGTSDRLIGNQENKNMKLQDSVVKTVASFLNSDGGNLLIGVLDKPRSSSNLADLVGIEEDYKWCKKGRQDSEGFVHALLDVLTNAISSSIVDIHVTITTPAIEGIQLCRIDVTPRKRLRNNDVWVKTKTLGDEEFFFRSMDTTVHASAKSAHEYIRHHFENSELDSNSENNNNQR